MEYDGERFNKYFFDFAQKYGITDMYSGGFYSFKSPEEYWAWWSRNIWLNRYQTAPKNTYKLLFGLVKNKNYFVITTNVDHQFQKAGFDKARLFYTQGDYGLFQNKNGGDKTYDNYEIIKEMILSQCFKIGDNNQLIIPSTGIKTKVSHTLAEEVKDLTMNLHVDDNFVEDQGWKIAAKRYTKFLNYFQNGKILYLELGVGMNTPAIIKYPFWKLTFTNPDAKFVTIDNNQILYPKEISDQTLAIKYDIDSVLKRI